MSCGHIGPGFHVTAPPSIVAMHLAGLVFLIQHLPSGHEERLAFVNGPGETIRIAFILLWQLIPTYSGARLRVNLKALADLMTSLKSYVQEQAWQPQWLETDLIDPCRRTEHCSVRELVRNMVHGHDDLERIKAGVVQLEAYLHLFRHEELEDAVNDVIGFAGDVILVSMGDKSLKQKASRRAARAARSEATADVARGSDE